MKIFVENNPLYQAYIKYTLRVFMHHYKTELIFTNNKQEADAVIDETRASAVAISLPFYEKLAAGKFNHADHFAKECLVRTSSGQPDYLATSFYLINSLQEYNCEKKDSVGRFPYRESYQHKFDNVKQNLVAGYFEEMRRASFAAIAAKEERSEIFLSHDIDNINKGWLEDGFAALKSGRVDQLFSLLFQAAMQEPHWFNIDQIMAVHDEYDLRSTFFWLCNKGRSPAGLQNADYDVQSFKVQKAIARVQQRGFENGIHKSASDESFSAESKKLGFVPIANRYHFLRFSLPDAYRELEGAGIQLDTSLGFSEQFGFRNSYGKPFQPFDLSKKKLYNLVEAPLHIMDRTFFSARVPVQQVAAQVIDFFEKNKYNCTLSVLWHNNFFDSIKYKGYLQEYKKILAYLYENKYSALTQKQIIEKYTLPTEKE